MSKSVFGSRTFRLPDNLCENRFDKNHPNQREQRIHQIITMEGICHFLDPKPMNLFIFFRM